MRWFSSVNVFHTENLLYPPDISFSAFHVLYSVCWPPGHCNMESKLPANHGRSGARQGNNAIMSHAGGTGVLLQELKLVFLVKETKKRGQGEGVEGQKAKNLNKMNWYLWSSLRFCCLPSLEMLQKICAISCVCVVVRGWAHRPAGVVGKGVRRRGAERGRLCHLQSLAG